MSSSYEPYYKDLFQQCLVALQESDPNLNPTILLANPEQINNLRARLSKCKRDHETLITFYGGFNTEGYKFKYQQDKEQPAQFTVQLVLKQSLPFRIVD